MNQQLLDLIIKAAPNVAIQQTRIEWEGNVIAWRDHSVTLQTRGREYLLGELTTYPNGRALFTRNALMRTATAHRAATKIMLALDPRMDSGHVSVVFEPEHATI